MSERERAARYEKLYPGTGVSEAQAAERMDRIDFKEDPGRRTRARRTFLVPDLPWKKEHP